MAKANSVGFKPLLKCYLCRKPGASMGMRRWIQDDGELIKLCYTCYAQNAPNPEYVPGIVLAVN